MSRSSGREFCRRHKHPKLKRPVSRDQIRREYEALYRKAGFKGPFVLRWPRELTQTHEENARRYAQVRVGEEPPIFELAEQTRWLPRKNRKALFAHEIGHVADPEADEPGADRAGSAVTGVKIGYDLRWPSTKRAKGLQVALNPRRERLREVLRRAQEDNTQEAWERYTREATRRGVIHPADAYLLGLLAAPKVLVDRGCHATPRQRAEFVLLEDLDDDAFRLLFDGTLAEQTYVDNLSGPPLWAFVALFCYDISRESQAGREIPAERLERRLQAARLGVVGALSEWLVENARDEAQREDARLFVDWPSLGPSVSGYGVAPYLAVYSRESRSEGESLYYEEISGMLSPLASLRNLLLDVLSPFVEVKQGDIAAAAAAFRSEWDLPLEEPLGPWDIWLEFLEGHLSREGYWDLLADRAHGVVGFLEVHPAGDAYEADFLVRLELDSEAFDSFCMDLLYGDDGLLTRYLRGEG